MGIVIKDALALVAVKEKDAVSRHTIYIEGSDIVGIDSAPLGFHETETIRGTDRLVIPGLINAHTHTYMSMMRNYADDLSFSDWLFHCVNPIEDQLEPQDAYWGSLLSQAEMIRSGTTCFNDQHMHIHMTTRAAYESGMRAVIGRGLVGDLYDLKDRRLHEALEEIETDNKCDRITFRLNPHAPYTNGPAYLRMVADVAREHNLGIHIHIAESQAETDTIWQNYHCTPVEYVSSSGIFDVACIAAHCIRVSDSDIAILSEKDVSVVTNPASNMKLGNGFAPIPELIEAGVNVCLGTDGAASNNAQNMFREMGFLALIHKGTHDTPQCVSADEAFRMATIKGARALRLPTGSIEVGLKADLAILRLDLPQMMPTNNLIAALAYSANGSEVDTVIIDGKIVMRGGELLTIDLEHVAFEIRRICHRLGMDKKP